ncbi:MAG TPA: hypothetical protein DCG47_01385 [Spirochaetaceae bacterium]|nr:hypothetical protein [Spirochaetaceae bacterium]
MSRHLTLGAYIALCIAALSLLGACDSFSLLDEFKLRGGLAIEGQKSVVQRGETIALYPRGGKAPYSYSVIAEDLYYSDSLGWIANDSFTAGNAIGLIRIGIIDAAGMIASCLLTIAPPSPTGFTVQPFSSNTVPIEWQYGDSSIISEFWLYRSVNGGEFTKVRTLGSAARTVIDSPVNTNFSYSYRLYAVSGSYVSPATPTQSPP